MNKLLKLCMDNDLNFEYDGRTCDITISASFSAYSINVIFSGSTLEPNTVKLAIEEVEWFINE